jgi:PAS domain S-box-containing protein
MTETSTASSPPPVATTATLERARDRFLAAIVDSAEDAIFAKALDGTILSWNAAAQRMYGYTPAEIIGSRVTRLAPPERHPEIQEILRRLARGEPIEHYETERVRASGERFPVSLAISPVRDATGRVIGASTVARDISESRRLAQALALQRAMLKAQSEASLDGIAVLDLDERLIFCNARLAEMWRLDGEFVEGVAGTELLQAMARLVVDPDAFMATIERSRDEPEAPTRDTVRLNDGRVLDRYSAPMYGPERSRAGRVWSFRDVTTETTRMAQLRAMVSSLDDAAIVFGPDGRVLLRNPVAAALLPGVEHQRDLRALVGGGDAGGQEAAVENVEVVLETPLGARRALVSIRPVTDPGLLGEAPPELAPKALATPLLGWLGVVRDVTELREIQASREAFLGVLSHELRTPITTIYGGAKMLLRTDLASARADLLADIAAESDRLYRLVEDLLVLTRIERETLELADQPVLIGPIVDRVATAERAREPRARLVTRVAEALPMVRGEDTYVEQIIRNLVGNAIKYGPEGGTVEVLAEPSPDGVAVRVLDEGPGISEHETDRVFELLYRSPVTAAQAAGSGIGLFVSRRLAEAMGGSISAQRRPDGGAEFRLELAAYREPADL